MIEHELLKLDVSGITEKKQGLTYLSWAHAWAMALRVDPKANFNVHTFGDDCIMLVNGTAMVWVDVTIGGTKRTCWLPVMNARNEPISIQGRTYKDKYGNDRVEKVDAFNVNTAIMRCLTKCLAMFGLGLNIYAGEDLPLLEDEKKEEKKPEKKEEKEGEKKPEKKEEKKEEPAARNEDESLTLFADMLVQYLEVQRTEAALKSYWKSNQGQIDLLKKKNPDMYELVLDKFKQAKANATV